MCYSSPCQNGARCRSTESDFFCECPPGFGGERCEVRLGEGECASEQEAVCQAPSECRAHKAEDGSSTWSCGGCSDNIFYDSACRLSARSFSDGSYAAFSELPQRVSLNLTLEFATQNPSGTLLFNGRLNDDNDYLSLRLEASNLLFQFSTGLRAQRVLLRRPGGFSDGDFHRVEVSYDEENVTLSFGHCDVKLALEQQAFIPESLRCANATVEAVPIQGRGRHQQQQQQQQQSCGGSFLNQCTR